jgi:hypothetical protein
VVIKLTPIEAMEAETESEDMKKNEIIGYLIEALIGGEEDTGECSSCKHAAKPDTLEPCKSCFKEVTIYRNYSPRRECCGNPVHNAAMSGAERPR